MYEIATSPHTSHDLPKKKPPLARTLGAFILALSLFSPCEALAKEVSVADTENGKTVNLEVGDTMSLSLRGNPTTGYTWLLTSIESSSLQKIGQYYRTSCSRCCGAPGIFTFVFQAVEKGSSTLRLTYARPWENKVPARTFEITVSVDSPK